MSSEVEKTEEEPPRQRTLSQMLDDFDTALIEAIRIIAEVRDRVHQAVNLIDKAANETIEDG